MKICENCGGGYNNSNICFCNRECQTEHMRKKECIICQSLYLPESMIGGNYCSKKCKMLSNFYEYRYNLQVLLRISLLCRPCNDHYELIDLKYTFRDTDTKEIYEKYINFDDDLKSMQEGK